MTSEQFQNEKMYQATMYMVRKLLTQGLITKEKYDEIDTIFIEKYHPILGRLLSDITG